MCRFLLAESEKPFEPQELVHAFAGMSEKSKAPDGSAQGDGSGISWWENNGWQVKTSLEPFWENTEQFSQIPSTTQLVMHARSASFINEKGVLEYNQPYISGPYSFVFNGTLKGVRAFSSLEGSIGAQKIWSLLQQFLDDNPPEVALKATVKLLNSRTKGTISAMNLGLADGQNNVIYYYSQFGSNPEYYNLSVYESTNMNIVCSEGLEGYSFKNAKPEEVFLL